MKGQPSCRPHLIQIDFRGGGDACRGSKDQREQLAAGVKRHGLRDPSHGLCVGARQRRNLPAPIVGREVVCIVAWMQDTLEWKAASESCA